MDKSKPSYDEKIEQHIIEALAPSVDVAFNEHMYTGPRMQRDTDIEMPETAGALPVMKTLYEAAGLPYEEGLTPELIETMRGSFMNHIDMLEREYDSPREAITTAALMNVSTEENLPHYHADQLQTYKRHRSFAVMLNRWTVEESFHAPLLWTWGMLTNAISDKVASAHKAALLRGGISVDAPSVVAINAYTDPQEFATKQAHQNLGRVLDPYSKRIMNALAGQEYRHGKLFRKLGVALYQLDDSRLTDYALTIESHTHESFDMPARASYPDFGVAAKIIATHGLFTYQDIAKHQVERIKEVGIEQLRPVSDAAKLAQEKLIALTDPADRTHEIQKRIQRIIEQSYERAVAGRNKARIGSEKQPFMLGKTVGILRATK
mgnify:CR=1 FL=1